MKRKNAGQAKAAPGASAPSGGLARAGSGARGTRRDGLGAAAKAVAPFPAAERGRRGRREARGGNRRRRSSKMMSREAHFVDW